LKHSVVALQPFSSLSCSFWMSGTSSRKTPSNQQMVFMQRLRADGSTALSTS
jgi:hypothetical protein